MVERVRYVAEQLSVVYLAMCINYDEKLADTYSKTEIAGRGRHAARVVCKANKRVVSVNVADKSDSPICGAAVHDKYFEAVVFIVLVN